MTEEKKMRRRLGSAVDLHTDYKSKKKKPPRLPAANRVSDKSDWASASRCICPDWCKWGRRPEVWRGG